MLARHLVLSRFLALICILVVIYGLGRGLVGFLRGTQIADIASTAYSFAFTPSSQVEQFDTRTNILLLGKAGEGNSAPELTDTIIVVSISSDPHNSPVMISVPRDIWIPETEDKINASYMIGNKNKKEGGLILAKTHVEDIVGIPLHYAAVVDLTVLEKVIDAIGGIEITVERSFTDTKYPILGKENDICNGDPDFNCRYETLTFLEGTQTMNGETAMKYSRSRQSTDIEEGTDFARARRQQQVLTAIKEKMLSKEILLNPRMLISLWQSIESHIDTDMTHSQMAIVARRLLQSEEKLQTHVLPEELLFNPALTVEYNYLYVFIPAESDDWSRIHEWVSSLL